MTDREKLVELLEDAPTDPMGNRNVGVIADYLLSHSVTVREPGRWINHHDDLFPAESTQECSVCNEYEFITLCNDNYCPNCGAKMEV